MGHGHDAQQSAIAGKAATVAEKIIAKSFMGVSCPGNLALHRVGAPLVLR